MSPATRTIVAIAEDQALLKSLAFALKAHGHRVKTFRDWRSARSSVDGAACVIVDATVPGLNSQDWLDVLTRGASLVLLAEQADHHCEKIGIRVLAKPLSGADLLAAVTALSRNP